MNSQLVFKIYILTHFTSNWLIYPPPRRMVFKVLLKNTDNILKLFVFFYYLHTVLGIK